MKSIFGLGLAALILLAFGFAWGAAMRGGASFLDQQWLFFTALPYNMSLVAISGDSPFSPDAPLQVIAAALSEATVGYVAGACIESAARAVWRMMRRTKSPA